MVLEINSKRTIRIGAELERNRLKTKDVKEFLEITNLELK